MPFDERDRSPERKRQCIEEAVALVEPYDSKRSRDADAEFHEAKKGSVVISTPDRSFTFFGSRHTNDAGSQTVRDLRDDVGVILSVVLPENIAFMVEGRHGDRFDRDIVLEEMEGIETVEVAVQKHGEKGVAMWVVADYAKRGIEIDISSPERPELEIADEVRKEYSAEDIATYLMFRQWTSELGGRRAGEYSMIDLAKHCITYARLSGVDWIADKKSDEDIQGFLHDRPVLEAYAAHVAQQVLDGLSAKTGLILSLDDLRNRRVDDAAMQTINELVDPLDHANRQTNVNSVAARWNEERDRFLVRSIGNAMAQGKKPYVIFGASHALHCAPALEKLMNIAK